MQGLDFANTKVLLIGASEFPNDPQIVDIPNVAVNIKKLSALLQDTELMGISEANITESLNERKEVVETKLNRIVKATNTKEHTLIVYYSGHGLYSKHDFKLYLTTNQTTEEDLEALGIKGDTFKEYIRRSQAGRKIVILDCCYSGKLLETMGGTEANVEVLLNSFEGTYVMASSASDEPSLFPMDDRERPTYFTEKLLGTVNEGLDNKSELCSLDDIFSNIEQALVQDGRPRPQQSVFKSVGEIGLCKNKMFAPALPDYEVAWQLALEKNSKWVYADYIKEFENSIYVEEAISKLEQLEDEERWQLAKKANTMAALLNYLRTQENGRHRDEAVKQLNLLRRKEGVENKKYVEKQKTDSPYSKIFFITFLILLTIILVTGVLKFIGYLQDNDQSDQTDNIVNNFVGKEDTLTRLNRAINLYNLNKYDSAFSLFEELAVNGNAESQNYLGWIYLNGFGVVEKDTATALKWFQQSADGENRLGQYNLACSYYFGYGPGKIGDYKKAFELFKKSAEQGYASGQEWLGWMYENGYGIDKKDSTNAYKYYQMSANQNLASGQYNLGRMYEVGIGTNKSITDAFHWYGKAADQGYEPAKMIMKILIRKKNLKPLSLPKKPEGVKIIKDTSKKAR